MVQKGAPMSLRANRKQHGEALQKDNLLLGDIGGVCRLRRQ